MTDSVTLGPVLADMGQHAKHLLVVGWHAVVGPLGVVDVPHHMGLVALRAISGPTHHSETSLLEAECRLDVAREALALGHRHADAIMHLVANPVTSE